MRSSKANVRSPWIAACGISLGALALSFAGCAPGTDECGPACGLTLGGPDDPVVQLALTTIPATVEITIDAPNNHSLTQGLITYAPLFTVGQTPSAGLAAYLGPNGPASG